MTPHTPLTPDLAAARTRLYANRDRNAAERRSRYGRPAHDGSLADLPRESNPVMVHVAMVRRARMHQGELTRWLAAGIPPVMSERSAA